MVKCANSGPLEPHEQLPIMNIGRFTRRAAGIVQLANWYRRMVAKTVYETHWKPSIGSLLVLAAAVPVIMYAPYKLQLPIFINPLLAIALQLVFLAGAVMFFYMGTGRQRQLQIIGVQICCYSAFGVLSNIFHQATYLVSSKILASDFLVVGLINVFAIALTLSFYRIKRSKIEVSEESLADSGPKLSTLRSITPLVIATPVIIFAVLMINSRYLPNGATFPLWIPFFIAAQIVLNIGGGFYMFKTRPRAEKWKLAFSVMALAGLYGTIGNISNHISMWRPGSRLMMSSNEFVLWNVGAIVTVLVFVKWMDYIAREQEKHSLRLPKSITEPAIEIATPAATNIATPDSMSSRPESNNASDNSTSTNTTTEASSTSGTRSEAGSAKQTVEKKDSDGATVKSHEEKEKVSNKEQV